MDEYKLELYWNEIPVGKENAITYPELVNLWNMSERKVRHILHELSCFDNGDDLILVRSASGKGFYKTDDAATIRAYRQECLNKGKSIFAPVKKINRVLRSNTEQISFENNLRVMRSVCGLSQSFVCDIMKRFDNAFDIPLLSKMENGVCMPTPMQLARLAEIYSCETTNLIKTDMY